MMAKKTDGRVSDSEAQAIANQELVDNQREVNEQLVLSALRAQSESDASQVREDKLLATAELREQLLGILGHDLRSPLAAMMMGVGILVARGTLNDDDAYVAVRVLSSGNRMSRMITQILDFTRARLGGGLLLDRRPSNIGEVCRTVAEELELVASVPVRCVVDGDMRGSWDVDRISEAFSNIGGNAIEHARTGTSVAFHAFGDEGDVVVEITNEGPPIPAEVLPFIFEPFRRARQREHSKAGNLGLGLYIAYEITRAHRGTLDVRSADGRTTFTMRLPRWPPPPPSRSDVSA
jgi:signal transduction histidine kinase